MLNTILSIIIFLIVLAWASIMFFLANIDRLLKEDTNMTNVIKVKPNKDGKIFITLYGTKYEIVVEEEKPVKKPAKTEE